MDKNAPLKEFGGGGGLYRSTCDNMIPVHVMLDIILFWDAEYYLCTNILLISNEWHLSKHVTLVPNIDSIMKKASFEFMLKMKTEHCSIFLQGSR